MEPAPEIIMKIAKTFTGTFTDTQLVEAVWIFDKKRFGLKGREEIYPDSNKILASLMGKRGLRARGLLIKIRPREYIVTGNGSGSGNGNGNGSGIICVNSVENDLLSTINTSELKRKYDDGKLNDITYNDLMVAVKKISNIEKIINLLRGFDDCGDVSLSNGTILTQSQQRTIINLLAFGINKFQRRIKMCEK